MQLGCHLHQPAWSKATTTAVSESALADEVGATGNSRPSKQAKTPTEVVREPLEGADSRPGRWVAGDWFLQVDDTVFMQVDGSCDTDPCTFFVRRSSSHGTDGAAEAAARVWVFRVESFEGPGSIADSSMRARFYYNKQRDLQQPLLFKRKSERLLLGKVQGIVHTLMPSTGSAKEVLQQLDSDLVQEVAETLWQKVDIDSGSTLLSGHV